MREVFVTELAKNVLGPRNGIRETMQRDPLTEYVTGVLAPYERGSNFDTEQDGVLPETESREYPEDGNSERAVFGTRHTSPSLDPRNTPSSMGLSFFVDTDKPRFEVCVTWSRYKQQDKEWTRNPSRVIFGIDGSDDQTKEFDGDGKQPASDDDVEISFHYRIIRGESGRRIQMSIVNRIRWPDDGRRTAYCIFQPQLRVRCVGNTKLEADFRIPTFGSDDGTDELVYEGRDFMAVGRLTSAVWRDIDPERRYDGPTKCGDPPFGWIDGEDLPEDVRKRFTAPDVRTEYMPTFSVPTADMEWRGETNPIFGAHTLAGLYDPAKLRDALSPIADSYLAWIKGVEKQVCSKPDVRRKAGATMVAKHRRAHRRIVTGVDFLCKNEDARLAFCFANKAVGKQYEWSHNGDRLAYRPYQLAFILTTLESAINKASDDRNVCDLLWVPTGTGKTEAYLVVMAMVMSYRRLRALKDGKSGAGVSVITRYTLRLLTIQQFRRTLSVVSAADCLRVEGVGTGKPVGWRPTGCERNEHFIWGSVPFGIGLWVGQSLTPNRMKSGYDIEQHVRIRGALDILKDKRPNDDSDPAQIVDCPACKTVLAIPDDGIPAGPTNLHFVAKAENDLPANLPAPDIGDEIHIQSVSPTRHCEPGFVTLTMSVNGKRAIKPDDVRKIWATFESEMKERGFPLSHQASRSSRLGYFERTCVNKKGSAEPYDFDIMCPNPKCPLRIKWAGGSPCGKVHAAKPYRQYDFEVGGKKVPDGNCLETVITPFRAGESYISDRVPLRAFTVDEQVYKEVPSIVVATVDKFARLPFEPKTGQLFGNVDRHHCQHGYERSDKNPRSSDAVRLPSGLNKPDMIIQDELHLLEGPLGSMVGAYETAIDFLSSGKESPVKYLAATATIRRPEDHVKSILNRDAMVFPPVGIGGDRFFINNAKNDHQLDDEEPGRLYLGICCPGRGNLEPLVRLWSSLQQTAHVHRKADGIDRFWTLTGYFNTVRELAGAVGMYRQDIPRRLKTIAPEDARKLETAALELSSRTGSVRLPSILDKLGKRGPDGGAPDSLFTTAMFGTGVDVSRLGLMIMNGQPKTATAYIQATGRVGRKRGALVVTLFGAARPRDLKLLRVLFPAPSPTAPVRGTGYRVSVRVWHDGSGSGAGSTGNVIEHAWRRQAVGWQCQTHHRRQGVGRGQAYCGVYGA